MNDQPPVKPSRHHIWHITKRTLSKSWDDSIFSESAQAAFWSRAVVAAAAAGNARQPGLHRAAVRPGDAADDPGPADQHGQPASSPRTSSTRSSSRPSATSSGAPAARWCRSGSSSRCGPARRPISAFVDSITEAHDQTPLRHPVRQRFFALGLYVVMLVIGDRDRAVRRAGPAQDRRAHPRQLGQRPALRLLPGAVPRSGGVGDVPLPGVAAQAAAVAPAGPRLGAGHRGVPGRHGRPADLPDLDHQHGLHLRRAGDADRVPAVRVLPRLRDHDRRRAERRHRGGVARARTPTPSGSGGGWRRRRPSQLESLNGGSARQPRRPRPRRPKGDAAYFLSFS